MGNIVFPPLSNKKAEVLLYTFRFSCVCLEVLCVKILFLFPFIRHTVTIGID